MLRLIGDQLYSFESGTDLPLICNGWWCKERHQLCDGKKKGTFSLCSFGHEEFVSSARFAKWAGPADILSPFLAVFDVKILHWWEIISNWGFSFFLFRPSVQSVQVSSWRVSQYCHTRQWWRISGWLFRWLLSGTVWAVFSLLCTTLVVWASPGISWWCWCYSGKWSPGLKDYWNYWITDYWAL